MGEVKSFQAKSLSKVAIPIGHVRVAHDEEWRSAASIEELLERALAER